ncbi:hypothetical protein HOD61_02520 [archaeon]|jgi:uncharacterized protein (UPF0147 family)|nr:hypothetical protein [archaeon]
MEYVILEIIERLNMLKEEDNIPRNMREKIRLACEALSVEGEDIPIKVNKTLQELEDVSSDVNTPSDVKSMLWSITSELECIK